ncbi:MAG: YceI family protein [Sphingomonadaceae bacterium]|nr:YceI family protein [Sphingomonadaceae bacterium]
MFRHAVYATLAAAVALPAAAQAPGAPDRSRVVAGTYAADPGHTQVAWSLDHLGFSTYDGLFGGATGTLTLDPAKPAATKVDITIPISGLVTTVPALNEHLKSPDFFDAAKFPTATFTSTSVVPQGTGARITGTLTLHGVSKPVVLDARFVGAGVNPLTKKATVGFAATTKLKRSDFGITTYLPILGDDVDLRINAAFEKAS